MSDTTTKLYDDLMGLREAAQYALARLEQCEGLGVEGVTEAANALFATLHPDSDFDDTQEAVYAALATGPDSDHREIARLRRELDILASATNMLLGISNGEAQNTECSHCGTRYSSGAYAWYPVCPNCYQVSRHWLVERGIELEDNAIENAIHESVERDR